VNFGLFTDQDATRFCYLRLRKLKEAIKDPAILDAVARELEVPGADQKGASPRQKLAAIERRIDELRATATSPWYGVPAAEVLAASVFGAGDSLADAIQTLFSAAAGAQDLLPAVNTWLKGGGLTPVRNVPFGAGLVEFVGYRAGFLSGPRVVAILVKNELAEIEPALNELVPMTAYTHATYLACTPAIAAEYLTAHAAAPDVRRWVPDRLTQRLHASGSGLLLVEGAALAQALFPKERSLDKAVLDKLALALQAKPGSAFKPK
jgi:hypothetical protein